MAATGGNSLLQWLSKNKKALKHKEGSDDSDADSEVDSEAEREEEEREKRKRKLIEIAKKQFLFPQIKGTDTENNEGSPSHNFSRKDSRSSLASSRLSNYTKKSSQDSQDSAYNTEPENNLQDKRAISSISSRFPKLNSQYEESQRRGLASDIAVLQRLSLSPRPIGAYTQQSTVHKSRFALSYLKRTIKERDKDQILKSKFRKESKDGKWFLEAEASPEAEETTTNRLFATSRALQTIESGPVNVQAFDNYKQFVKNKPNIKVTEESKTDEEGKPTDNKDRSKRSKSKKEKKKKKEKDRDLDDREQSVERTDKHKHVEDDKDHKHSHKEKKKKKKKSKKVKKENEVQEPQENRCSDPVDSNNDALPVVVAETVTTNTENHNDMAKTVKNDTENHNDMAETVKNDTENSSESHSEDNIKCKSNRNPIEEINDHNIDDVEDYVLNKINNKEQADKDGGDGVSKKRLGRILRRYLNKRHEEIQNSKAAEEQLKHQASAIVENSKKEKEQISNIRKAEQDKISKKLEMKLKAKKETRGLTLDNETAAINEENLEEVKPVESEESPTIS